MGSKPLNILLVIWDACRLDYAHDHAPTFNSLAEDNLRFDCAITPAPWSLPAHASLFTGKYPHEHGVNQLGDSMESMTLASRLSSDGYTTYGVSANGFACQRTGFHTGFDEFYYTVGRERYGAGLNVSGFALDQLHRSQGQKLRPALRTLVAAASHEHPLKSLVNVGTVGLGSLGVRSETLQRVPHPLFSSNSGYVYSPTANTSRLIDILQRESESDGPFFAFANYMDTHRPYKPVTEKQRSHLGHTLSRSELEYLNDEVAHPWNFLTADRDGDLTDEEIESVRGLYAGEVETADEHLSRLLKALEETGQRENTLVIVTSDHGENLGETDELGRRRMGHEASVSDPLAHVPLVVAHPQLEEQRVTEPYSLVQLFDLLTGDLDSFVHGDEHFESAGVASCQYPPAGGKQLYGKYPNTPTDALDHRIEESSVVVYDANWRVGMESSGKTWAVQDGASESFEDAPERLRNSCEAQLAELPRNTGKDRTLGDDEITQLESLGYM